MRNAVLTEKAPKPIGPYSQGIIEGDFIFVAGQGPINPLTGKLELGDVRSETKRTFENLRAILQAAGASLQDVIKCNVYLRDINDFRHERGVRHVLYGAVSGPHHDPGGRASGRHRRRDRVHREDVARCRMS